MSRFYSPISKEDFLDKVKELMSQEYDIDDNDDFAQSRYPYSLRGNIVKDLHKVEFDFENYSVFEDIDQESLLGYHEISPGFHTFFAWAGGDWEYPVSFIFYFYNNEIRAYIPRDGNIWDKICKCAFNNEEARHMKQDNQKIIKDILKRIKLKEC